jgi:extracellular solute-binding protein family 5
MLKNRKNKFLILIAVLFTLFVACGGGNKEGNSGNNSGNPDELVVGVTSFADTLEPTDQYFSWVVTRYGVGENLTSFDDKGNLQPLLAESWKLSDDKLEWTFKIRDGVTFSNGNPLTAEAVKKSIERVFEKNKRAESFFTYTSIEADGQNLKIKTKEPVAILPESLADPLFLIVDTTANTEEFAQKGPIATGPFIVQEFKPGEYTVVVRNEKYWNGKAKLAKVTFKDINDQNTRALSLKSGEIDVAYNLKVTNKADFEGDKDIVINELKSLRSTYAFMNQTKGLKDKVLREAIIRGANRENYTQNLLQGGATPGKAPIPPTLDFGFNELKDENAYNRESAKKLLTDAGYKDVDGDGYLERPDGSKLDLNFVIYTSRAELGIYAQALQADMKEIGIKVTLKPVSYETVLSMRDDSNFDMLIWNVLAANTGDPEKYLNENWYSKAKTNKTGYANPEVDKLINELSKEFDKAKRKELTIKIQQLIMNDAATLFFGYETTFLYSKKSVTGLKMYPMDYYWITKDVAKTK